LHDVVAATAASVLANVGLRVRYAGVVHNGDARWGEMVAVIGLGGSKLRGTLALSVPASLLRRSHPTGGTEHADLADWLAEQANLLLGRIKAQLLMHEITVELSTPITLAASEFNLVRFGSSPFVHEFELEGEWVCVGFESVAQEGVEFRLPARADAAVEAGEVVLF
jgi:hypothetical protein